MASPSSRASRTPTTPAPEAERPRVDPLAPIIALGVAQAEAATAGKSSDVVHVYNKHVGRIAGIEPMSRGKVRRTMLDRYSWALRIVS